MFVVFGIVEINSAVVIEFLDCIICDRQQGVPRKYNSVIHIRSYPIGTTGTAKGVRVPISVWRHMKVETRCCIFPYAIETPWTITIYVVLAFNSIKDLKMRLTKKIVAALEFSFFVFHTAIIIDKFIDIYCRKNIDIQIKDCWKRSGLASQGSGLGPRSRV